MIVGHIMKQCGNNLWGSFVIIESFIECDQWVITKCIVLQTGDINTGTEYLGDMRLLSQ